MDSYIESLNRTNPSLAEIIQNLWTQVQEEPERYRGQSITGVLDQMIESVIDSHIESFAKRWYIGADELRYYIQHYRKGAKNKPAKPADQEPTLQRLQGRSSRCPQPTQL